MQSAQVVHESERSRVTRLFRAEHTVVRKEPLGPDAEHRLRNETAMLERLRGVDGVAQLAETPRFAGSIVLADVGGTDLVALAKPVPVDDLIGLAVGLAGAVAGMHRRGVIHRDITPANILVAPDGAPFLVDFALATSFAEIRPEFTHHSKIEGTLAYLAPEQTGRTGRPVDQRADLYALGTILYELATGEAPFGAGDPLQLTHDHLARRPVPPAEVNGAVPAALSEIIMHLLEKEPDNRYQTADGLLYDLERLRAGDTGRGAAPPGIGEQDFPVRILSPSRLAGRDDEKAALEAAFQEARAGQCRGVLVSGAPGVGKTALVDEMRPVVTGADGWFVAGKFDQYRRDLEFDGVHQALRALGRLLLAEPEDELAQVRDSILGAVGPNAGLLTAVLPEFAALLAVPPDPGDPLTAQVRAQRVVAGLLRAVASPARPVVFCLDDLQWAGRTPLGLVDVVFSEEPVEGLVLVGAYRDDVDGEHPLAGPLSRWREQPAVRHLHLVNLSEPSLVAMVTEMLHVDGATATDLVKIIGPQTRGNPYETVELLDALRRDGVLRATAAGWQWDKAAVCAHQGSRCQVAGLVADRVAALPPTSRRMLEAMACLGGKVELTLLQTAATGEPACLVEELAAALDGGLLVMEPGPRPAVRFRHDRTRDVILGGLDPPRRRTLQLAMARRLAAVPEFFAAAAEQYLPVAEAVGGGVERRQVVGLLRRAADQATVIGDYGLVNRLLVAALELIDRGETAMLGDVLTARHAALYSLGRFDEADEEYRSIEALRTSALERGAATVVQVLSLTHRSRLAEAIEFGLEALREFGITVPAANRFSVELDRQFDHLYGWLEDTEAADDLARPDITEPELLTASRLIDALLPATYFVGDHATNAWLSLEALRIWREHGAAPTLIGPASNAAFATVTLRSDYAAAYRAVRRILAHGEARRSEPGTSHARFLFSTLCCWFERVENSALEGRRAREGLIAGGDLANAGYVWHMVVTCLLDCAPSLDICAADVDAGLAFVRQSGGEQIGEALDCYRWLTGVLRGEDGAAVPIETYAGNPLAFLFAHLTRAVAAAIFGDPDGLARHTPPAMVFLPAILGSYPTAVAYLLRGLTLAGEARAAEGDQCRLLLAELDDVTQWLAGRAADAPANFLHLLRLVEAEGAWAVGDFRGAVLAFDSARREAARVPRRWHRALIAERAARFYLAHGVEQAGYDLLAEARQEYLAWGATAKVDQLDWAYPALPPGDTISGPGGSQARDPGLGRSTVTTGTVDLLGIVSATQALSSETSIERLQARVARVLSELTGASGVALVLWSDDRQDWLLPPSGNETGTVPVSGERPECAVPVSVLRYVQRMPEPLVVGDATRDDRFARDPYFSAVGCCSLLAIPVVNRGTLQAILLVENRLLRGAFTSERLDAVKLIAAQLAVSLDNAQLYAEFRRVADEQAALRRVATLVALGVAPEEVFAAVTEEVGRLLDADFLQMTRYDPDGGATIVGLWATAGRAVPAPVGSRVELGGRNATTLVLQTGRPVRVDDYGADAGPAPAAAIAAGMRSSIGAPIIVEGRTWGVMLVSCTREEPLPVGAEVRLAGFTELAGTAIANAESQAQLTGSRARIVAAADQARSRIERDLHDGAQQR
ncbi:MAG: hypothetical protein QOE80_1545, partial [Actinomycetota bacterium]|nr:hypothetical protein [Actinomycetota bacterium]